MLTLAHSIEQLSVLDIALTSTRVLYGVWIEMIQWEKREGSHFSVGQWFHLICTLLLYKNCMSKKAVSLPTLN